MKIFKLISSLIEAVKKDIKKEREKVKEIKEKRLSMYYPDYLAVNSWPDAIVNDCVYYTQILSILQAHCNYYSTAPHKDDKKYDWYLSRLEILSAIKRRDLCRMHPRLQEVYKIRLKVESKTWQLSKDPDRNKILIDNGNI